MFKHILLATDGSDLAERAASQGLELAKRLEARVTAVVVTEPRSAVMTAEAALRIPAADYEKDVIEIAESILSRIAEMAKSMGLDCATIHIKGHLPDEGIIAAAKDNGCDLIGMGSHGRRGFSRLLLGSVATRVVTLSPVPVLICR